MRISPTLLYLPALTPVGESLQLLDPAYEALFVLAGKDHGDEEIRDKMRL